MYLYGSFYDCIILMGLKNVVRSGLMIFVKYFLYLISHIVGPFKLANIIAVIN